MRCSAAVLRIFAPVLFLLALLFAPTAEAQPEGCSPDLQRWAARCAESRALSLQVIACPSDALAVLSAQVGGAPALRIELSRGDRGFRRVGGYALSPIGEFPDWQQSPPTLRDAFERVVACAQTEPPQRMRRSVVPALSISPSTPAPRRAPWLLALAAILAIAFSRKDLRRTDPRALALLLATGAATLALRAALHPAAYFHQNGQGPLWIEHLFSGGHHPYGPGFSELFAAVAHRAPRAPEAAVFAAQSLLAAAQPACAWWIARAAGANPWVAGALSLAVTLDPSLGRTARSEAYFAAGVSLSLLAAVAVTRAGRRWWPLVVAGLLLAQAVRVHPGLWTPAAMVPLCALVVAGTTQERARALARAFAVIGAVVALTSAPAVLAVLRSDLASQWMGAQSRGGALPWSMLLGGAVAVAASAVRRETRAAAIPIALAAITLVAATLTDNYTRSGSPAWIVAAYGRCFLPMTLASIAALTAALPARPRLQPALGAALALVLLAATNRHRAALTALPTDALELQRAWSWRDRLPPRARVFFVARAGQFVLGLPIHGRARGVHAVSLDIAEPPPDLRAYGPGTWYYRASTCASPTAAAWCDAFERAQHMSPVFTAEIPAVTSMRHLRYNAPTVRVGLYRVTD